MKRLRRTGVVRDPTGAPVGGAVVRAFREQRGEAPDAENATGADGTFELELAARSYTLVAHHEALCAEQYVVSTHTAPVILELRTGSSVTVHARREDGTPVVGAKVRVGHASTVTDAAGTVRAAGLSSGLHHVAIHAPGLADVWDLCSLREPVEHVTRTFTLAPATRFEGIVRGPLGRRVPNASITAWRANGGGAVHAMTGEDGHWTIELPVGTFRATAHYPGFEGSSSVTLHSDGVTRQSGFVIDLGFGSARSAITSVTRRAIRNLRDPSRYRISGVVVDETGTGCAARVFANPKGIPGGWRLLSTDAQGRFELDDLEPVEYTVMAAWNDPRHDVDASGHVQVKPGASLTLSLKPAATVTGRVVFDGAPLGYFGIGLWAPDVIGGHVIAVESTDGRFTLPKVGRGSWQLAIMGLETRRHLHPITIDNGRQTIDLGDIELTRGRTITGRVRDVNGDPVAGARIGFGFRSLVRETHSALDQAFGGLYETTSDADGTYRFGGVHPDEQIPRPSQVWATAPGMASLIREVGDSDTIEFILLGAGRITGSVRGATRHLPLIHATRADETKDARLASANFHDQTFRFDDVPLGNYILSLGDEVDAEPVTVTVRPGQTAHAVLTVTSRDVQVEVVVPRGRVHDLQVEPVSPGAEVRGRVRTGMTMTSDEPRDHETCTLHHVRPGTYRMSLDGSTWTEVVVAHEPAVQTFDLRK